MYLAHFTPSNLSEGKFEKLIILNGNPQDVEFRLPYPEEHPDNIALSWVSFFQNHIDSGLRISPAPFFIDLAKAYVIPLNQFNPFSLCRTAALHILSTFYSLPDSVGLIHASHSLKRAASLYYLSPRIGKNISFLSHKSINKDYQISYFCVKPTSETAEWPYS